MDFSYFFALEPDIPAGLGVPHFSAVHLAWLAGVLALSAGAALIFYRAGTRARGYFLSVLAGGLLSLELLRVVWLVSIDRFDPRFMLPLHLCGVMIFVGAAAVFTKNPYLRELSYCLGMPGAFFALLTPESTIYPLFNFYYLLFIATHTLLFLLPLLLLLDGFRPSIRRLPVCLGVLGVIIVVDGLANRLLDANYLFLNAAPAGSPLTLLAKLPKPLYLPGALLLLLLIWWLLYLPWQGAPVKTSAAHHEKRI